MTGCNPSFELFDRIMASLDERPRALLKARKKMLPPKGAVCLGDIPRGLWGLYNFAVRAGRSLEEAQKKVPVAKISDVDYRLVARTNQVCADLLGVVLMDEVLELQKFGEIYSGDGKLYGMKPTDATPTRLNVIELLRRIHQAQKGSDIPLGASPPYGYPLVGDTPPWLLALQTVRVRLSTEITVRAELCGALERLAQYGVRAEYIPLLKSKDSGITTSNDGKMYEVPNDPSDAVSELVEQLRGMFGDNVEVETSGDNKRSKRLM